MTLALLLAGLLLPLASIGVDLLRDAQDLPPLGHARARRRQQEVERLTAPLPKARDSLLPEDFYATWPQRQTPSDLPPRMFLVVAADRVGRHRAPEPVEELSTTGQFWAIVEDFGDLTQPCAHCTTPEDGEPAHAGCPGCACPCGLAVAV